MQLRAGRLVYVDGALEPQRGAGRGGLISKTPPGPGDRHPHLFRQGKPRRKPLGHTLQQLRKCQARRFDQLGDGLDAAQLLDALAQRQHQGFALGCQAPPVGDVAHHLHVGLLCVVALKRGHAAFNGIASLVAFDFHLESRLGGLHAVAHRAQRR